VAGDLGIGGRFTERGDKELGPTVHADRDLVFFRARFVVRPSD
jgi:hypothetical protein